jgi:D-3-phosphoglycerate dehydrogenase
MSKTILECDPVDPSGLERLREAGFTVNSAGQGDIPVKEAIGDADAIIVRSGTTVDAELLDCAKNLSLIGRAGVGVDNIDIDEATKRGIVVMNTPTGNIRSAAEHTIALMFAVSRNIPAADREVRKGNWPRKELTGVQVKGKTLSLVGLGKVGRGVAEMAQGAGMDVIAVDPYLSEEKASELNIELVELDDALTRADYLSVHTPLNEKTRGMIGKHELSHMKDSAVILNCARGGIIDEQALYETLKNKAIRGAGIDTFTAEPPTDSPLLELENTVLTPHLGASTEEAQEKVSRDIAEQIIDYFENDVIRNAVNFVAVDDPQLDDYMTLGFMLGSIVSQVVDGSIQEVRVQLSGAISELDAEPLSRAGMQGVLSPFTEQVNLVNANFLARERGIELVESRTEHAEDFNSTLEVSVRTSEEQKSVTGTVLENGEPRLIRFGDLKVDVQPSGRLLIMFYPDIPGQVGKFGTILGSGDINIASMEVGRRQQGEEAVVILTLDDVVPEELQQKLKEEAGVKQLWYLEVDQRYGI